MKNGNFKNIIIAGAIIFSLSACTNQKKDELTVTFKNGLVVSFGEGLCDVKDTNSPPDVRATVLVVVDYVKANQSLHRQERPLVVGDAIVMHPDHPPEVPKFPVFIISNSGQLVEIIGNKNAVPQQIVDFAIPMASAARHACQVAQQAPQSKINN